MQKKIYLGSVILLGAFFTWYLFTRSALLSMTHDESGTTDMVVVPVIDIMFSSSQFQTANNHILNSILLKASVLLFGYKEWAVRLPNVLSFLLYFISALWLLQRLTKNNRLRIVGIFILCSVPYLLDFFALARGYGLANTFGMAALVLLAEYFYSSRRKFLLFSFVAAALASYSNFTWLNLYLGLWAVTNLAGFFFDKKEDGYLKWFFWLNIFPAAVVSALALLSYKPISFLRTKDEFKWGAVTWQDSFHTFLNDVLYGQSLPLLNSSNSHLLLKLAIPALVLLVSVFLIRHVLKTGKKEINSFAVKTIFVFTSLLLIIVTGTILQKHLLNTFYIDGRKATIYIPVLLCILVSGLVWLYEKNKMAGSITTAFFFVCFLAQFTLTFNFKNCREWWYDATSREAVEYIIQQPQNSGKKVAVNWLFRPSFQFYNQHHHNNRISKIVKTQEKEELKEIDFYYVVGDEIRSVPPSFKIVKRYFWDRFLLQNDTVAYTRSKLQLIQQQPEQFLNLSTEQQLNKADSVLQQQRQQLNWNDLLWKE
jgi:hypothetical protein